MIRIENLTKKFGKTQALAGIDLHVGQGELFAYLGPNGAGKTTTIRILTGLTRIGSGLALLGGHDIAREATAAKRQCGLAPQQINLDNELTVAENLDIHGRLFSMSRAERRRRIDELLAYIELSDRPRSLVKHLSGGLKRRLLIARALMHEPKILFLDEPTVGLDPAIRRRIWALIKKVRRDGATIFLTTHYIEEAEFLADRVAFIDRGRIVAVDTPAVLMAAVGEWAVDRVDENGMTSAYFPDRDSAQSSVSAGGGGFTLRRVNLEDAFLARTGKKMVVDGQNGRGGH
ncbi:MAG: ATP-binding cassette domain-containing protein [Desulfobulbaceae bacterium]|jgi:ABC-2 type transport system ATP-binding protein|nr:ATP-binding cassette domain-containing protein [Desulfobulbaceae bacterium]